TLNWTAGFLDSAAAVTIATNGVLNISGSNIKFPSGVLTNAGTIIWSGTGNLNLSGTIVNLAGATFNAENDQTIANAGAAAAFYNEGLFVKSAGLRTNLFSSIPFTNSGTVQVESGTIALTTNYSLAGGALAFNLNSATNFGRLALGGGGTFSG